MKFLKNWDWLKYSFRESSRIGELFWCFAYFCWCIIVTHKKPIYFRLAWINNAHPFWSMRWDRFLFCCVLWWIVGLTQYVILIMTTNKFIESIAGGTIIMIMIMTVFCFFSMIYCMYDHYRDERENM